MSSRDILLQSVNKLKAAPVINERNNGIYDVVQQAAQPKLNVLDVLEIDVLCIGHGLLEGLRYA